MTQQPAQAPTASPGREHIIPIRMRPDLIVQKLQFGRRSYWNIKDPISLRFYQLREEEYFILRSLTGKSTFADVRRQFERIFAPLRLGAEQLQAYLASLAGQGLIVDDRPGRGANLLTNRNSLRRHMRLHALANVFAIRWRGINPERLLCWLYPKCSWLFSRWAICASAIMVLMAMTLTAVQLETVVARLPTVGTFLSVTNLPWIALAIGASKVLHEFGHALTCKHFGGECREMGVMLLVFTPCLYCNVSDAWMMKTKWHRIAISAAGIYFEVVLATFCFFLWLSSEPGLLNTVCLNVMLICSVNTLLFNGNPLLRYDGYYVLLDLVEVPNLRQRAGELLDDTVVSYCFGVSSTAERQLPERGRRLLLTYVVVSTLYRLAVLAGILWFLHAALQPHGLAVLAHVVAVLLVFIYSRALANRVSRMAKRVAADQHANRLRAATIFGTVCLLLLIGLVLPLPHAIVAPVVIEPQAAQTVFVPVRGRLPRHDGSTKRVQIGDRVRQGETLVTLENAVLESEILKLQGDIASMRSRVDSLQAIRVTRREVGVQIPTLEQILRDLEEQLREKQTQYAQLVVTAPVGGIVLPDRMRAPSLAPDELGAWSGTPLDVDNAGCTLDSGTVLCLVGDPQRMSALIIVDQSQIEYCRVGQAARCRLHELPGATLAGTVADISETQLEEIPASLLSQRVLSTVERKDGTLRPATTSFMVRVPIDAIDRRVPVGSTGWAKINTDPLSISQRVLRFLASTFGFV